MTTHAAFADSLLHFITRDSCREWLVQQDRADFDEVANEVFDALTAFADEQIEEPFSLANRARLLFGEAVDWLAEAEARAADWLDWNKTQEDARF